MPARRPLPAAVAVLVVAVAAVVVPVPMAWSAPAPRLAELAVPAVRAVGVPFARLAPPLGRTVTAPFGASHLAVRWTGGDDAVVELRTALVPGAWGPWEAVEVAHDLGDDARRRVRSGLVRAGGSRH
ncbi:MAG TPA: hypothetical protein VM263_02910, partial [Acidimicrobiales bacterium]|nr:hypothetical protein [Acidimicrobiales bacterium]